MTSLSSQGDLDMKKRTSVLRFLSLRALGDFNSRQVFPMSKLSARYRSESKVKHSSYSINTVVFRIHFSDSFVKLGFQVFRNRFVRVSYMLTEIT